MKVFICEICEAECDGVGPHCEDCADDLNDCEAIEAEATTTLEEGYFH